jgi:RHS repeat-associated protein
VPIYSNITTPKKVTDAGGQRIASKLWQWQYNPTANPSQDPITPVHPHAVQNNIVLEDLMDVLTLWDGVLGGVVPTLQELQHMQLPTRAPYQTELCAHYTEDPQGYPNELQAGITTLDHINCLCRNGQTAYVWQNYGVSCHNFEELYFLALSGAEVYHPDYLSNTEYVTDAGGYVYQYLFYSPFGESLYSQHAQTGEYNTPHRFNAKELDEETGLYYYGARYYNPRVSVWLGVDPLAHISPDKTPYHFVSNNPIMKIDPDGRHDDWVESADGDIYWDDNATSQETTKEGEKYLGKEGTSLNEETGRRVHYKPDGTKNEFDNILSEITINVKNGHVHQTSNPSISTNNKTGYTYNERDLAIRESILSTNNPIATYLRRQESLGNFWILNGRDYWSYYGHTLGNLMLADKYIQMADMVTGGPQPGRLIVPRGIMPGKGSNLPKPNLPSLPDPTGMDNYLRTGSGGIGGM